MAQPGQLMHTCIRVKKPSQHSNAAVEVRGPTSLDVSGMGSFTADHVLDGETTQSDFYEKCLAPLVRRFTGDCISLAVLGIGEAGSGRTHTLEAPPSAGTNAQNRGVIHRIVPDVYDQLAEKRKEDAERLIAEGRSQNDRLSHRLHCKFVQLVGEELRDLLAQDPDAAQLTIEEDELWGPMVQGLTSKPCDDKESALREFFAGAGLRRKQADKESASIFILECQETQVATSSSPGMNRWSRVMVVDLPESGQLCKDAQVVISEKGSQRYKSILAFSRLLKDLSGPRAAFADFSLSRLNRLLVEPLGGNFLTLMIATVSSEPVSKVQTKGTLDHLAMAKKVRNYPVAFDDTLRALLSRHRRYTAQLMEMNNQLRGAEAMAADAAGLNIGAGSVTKIHELQGQVTEMSMRCVRMSEERDRLSVKLGTLREKYATLAEAKGKLQLELIEKEEERLRIAQALIDMQIDKTTKEMDKDEGRFALQAKLMAAENDVVEIGMKEKALLQQRDDIKAQLEQKLDEQKEIAMELVALKANLDNSRSLLNAEQNKNEELSVELLNLVNARNQLQREKDLAVAEKKEVLAAAGRQAPEVSSQVKAELSTLRESVRSMQEAEAQFELQVQKRDVKVAQLQLQLDEAAQKAKSSAVEQSGHAAAEAARLEAELRDASAAVRQRSRAFDEMQKDLRREQQKGQDSEREMESMRERTASLDGHYRQQMQEHVEDLTRLSSAATPRSDQLNARTRQIMEGLATELRDSYGERENQLRDDLAATRQRLQHAVRKQKRLYTGYRELRHALEDRAPRGETPDLQKEWELLDRSSDAIDDDTDPMEEELKAARSRIESMEQQIKREKDKTARSAETYQKMLTEQQMHAANNQTKLEQQDVEMKSLHRMAADYKKLQESVASGSDTALHDKMEMMNSVEASRKRIAELEQQAKQQGRESAAAKQADPVEIRNYKQKEDGLRDENMRLNRELQEAQRLLDKARSEKSMIMGASSHRSGSGLDAVRGLKNVPSMAYDADEHAKLEAELADWKTRATVAESQLEALEELHDEQLTKYKGEIRRLRSGAAAAPERDN